MGITTKMITLQRVFILLSYFFCHLAEGKKYLIKKEEGNWLVETKGNSINPRKWPRNFEQWFNSTVVNKMFNKNRTTIDFLPHGDDYQIPDRPGGKGGSRHKPTCHASCCWNRYKEFPHTILKQKQIVKETQKSLERCAYKCENMVDCRAFQYNKNYQTCWLMKDMGDDQHLEHRRDGRKKGFYIGICDGHIFYETIWNDNECDNIGDYFFDGRDYKKSLDCKKLCREDERCTGFNFCMLKDSSECILRACQSPMPDPTWAKSTACHGYVVQGHHWFNGPCVYQPNLNGKNVEMFDLSDEEIKNGEISADPEEVCLENCKIFGLKGCQMGANKKCTAFMTSVATRKQQNDQEKCFPMDSDLTNRDCAYPKFGFVIEGNKRLDLKNTKTASECAELCGEKQGCRFWSFIGCVTKPTANEVFKCRPGRKYYCTFFNLEYAALNIVPTDNLHAAWGDTNACRYVGCKPIQEGYIIDSEDKFTPSNRGVSDLGGCKDWCHNIETCIQAFFHKDGINPNDTGTCYAAESNTPGLIPLEDRYRQYTREECHNMCRRTENCLQWDWRLYDHKDFGGITFSICRMSSKVHQVHLRGRTRKYWKEGSAVGTKHSCLQSGVEWNVGRCLNENGRPLAGDFSTKKDGYTKEECARFCIEDDKTTACEYDKKNKKCRILKMSVSASDKDADYSCSVLIPK